MKYNETNVENNEILVEINGSNTKSNLKSNQFNS